MRRPSGNVKMAFQSLRAARWRSWLTMLGIIVGIVSVVTIVSLGAGIKKQVSGQINSMGNNLLTIRAGTINSSVHGAFHSLSSLVSLGNGSELSANDLQVVRNTPQVAEAVPFSIAPGTLQIGGQTTSTQVTVIATSSDALSVLHQSMQYGNFLSDNQSPANLAVIGNALALSLFQTDAPLGQSFTFRGQQFIVGGVMNTFDAPPLSLDTNFNNVIFVPYAMVGQLEQNGAPLYQILVTPTKGAKTADVQQAIINRLRAAHGGAQDFSVLTQSQTIAEASTILNLLTGLISGVAAISLLVGGIGIMNVTLVSVSERTREIGIRKSLGATNRQIRQQFLTEAAVLSFSGGFVAILISLLINIMLRAATSLTPTLSWQVMVGSTLVAVAIGIIFGLAPAVKAARKDPIAALRHE
jgi:ABC-type antimicrobial peptide transport system permease subunit